MSVAAVAESDRERSRIPSIETLNSLAPEESLTRCTAHSKRTGERCGARAVGGAVVCKFHGGGAPQVRRKAALRLAALVDPAIAVLAREMVQADRSSDRQAAANSVLDRAGVVRANDDADMARALLMERLLTLRSGREEPQAGTLDDAPARPVLLASPLEDDTL